MNKEGTKGVNPLKKAQTSNQECRKDLKPKKACHKNEQHVGKVKNKLSTILERKETKKKIKEE
jgi:hypothetical protein